MTALFVSHSGKDDAAVSALEAWLHGHGFADVFVDHSATADSEKWLQALREAADVCRVVLCLVTERWLASDACFDEFKATWFMGKRIVPLLALAPSAASARQRLDSILGQRLDDVLAEDQGFDIAACMNPDGRLHLSCNMEIEARLAAELRAAGALEEIGLDPQAFAIDRKLRPIPFPGLTSFGDEDADAALFFGRSREIAEVLEELRKVRAERDLRPFVILGASGVGKSSLLKAGIIPRLRREAPAWLPLRAFRPGADPLLNFADALIRSLADFGESEALGLLRDRLFDAWSNAERADGHLTPAGLAAIGALLETEGRKLREAAGRGTATILISIDQAEEIAREESDSGEALADYLHVALTTMASSWQLAFTIRTDSFPELQSHHRFQNLEARGYDLRAVPGLRLDGIIEQPAKRYDVAIGSGLVAALKDDANTEDALPLLAFALQRLWRRHASSGALTEENYEKIGTLKGVIEDAAERALRGLRPDEDVRLPLGLPTKERLRLAASTFVPALARINDQGATIDRMAAWGSFNAEQRELLIGFERWGLIVRKGEGDGTVEIAHEALFREWTRLEGWLEPEWARFEALRMLRSSALMWDHNGRSAAFINHHGKRLAETDALFRIGRYRKRLDTIELAYLEACRAAERKTMRRRRRVCALIGMLLAAGIVGRIERAALEQQINWWTTMRPYMLADVRPYVLGGEAERALNPGSSFSECARDCPEMMVVPAGTFLMGSPSTEPGRYASEGPTHEVTIAKPFAVAKFDVTFADWDACVVVGGCPHVSDSGMGRGTKPVINVTWNNARTYAAWLSEMTGKPYRLLTEAEWEYAARAGTTTAYFWGDKPGHGNADCVGCGSQWDGRQTSPVGSFKANGFGLYDMAGNVWQWVEDCYHENYDGAPADGSAWTSPDCKFRVVRGGSWDFDPPFFRAALRIGSNSAIQVNDLGFRVARTLSP